MNVGVIGLGHVGLVSAACFAKIGHHVIGVDSQKERVDAIRAGKMPFFEPGLEELVQQGLEQGRLDLRHDLADVVEGAEVIFICVGTPSKPSGEADLVQVEGLTREIARHVKDCRVLAEKSTVPVRTGGRIVRTLAQLGATNCEVVSNPEFLREGSAIGDTLHPDRIVIGSGSDRATKLLEEVYAPIVEDSRCEVLVTDVATAELIKHASNAFLATKISFINAVADICEETGADVEVVARGMGLDPRIGRSFLRAGAGYGGACFPKDVSAFAALARQIGTDFSLLDEVQAINAARVPRLIDKLRGELWHLEGKTIGILGLAFKKGTDDLREAPALKVIEALLAEGADVAAYDPVAMLEAKELFPAVRYAPSALEAVKNADAAVFVTDWDEFRGLDLDELRDALRFPIVVDGRNLFDPEQMKAHGFTYLSTGRPPVGP